MTFGAEAIDNRIEGGLMQRALHEVFAASVEDASAAATFALLIGLRASPVTRPKIGAVAKLVMSMHPDWLNLASIPTTSSWWMRRIRSRCFAPGPMLSNADKSALS